MTARDEERIAATIREEKTRLLREYARIGYKAVHGQDDERFEALWSEAVGVGSDEEKPRD
jgi:hypothetical protein